MKLHKKLLPVTLLAAISVPVGAVVGQDDKKDEAKPDKPEVCETCQSGKKGGPDAAARFAELDANKDGKITEAEVIQLHQKRVEEFAKKHFAGMDLDENGVVTETEMKIVSRHMGMHRKPHGMRPPHEKSRRGRDGDRDRNSNVRGPRPPHNWAHSDRGPRDGHGRPDFHRGPREGFGRPDFHRGPREGFDRRDAHRGFHGSPRGGDRGNFHGRDRDGRDGRWHTIAKEKCSGPDCKDNGKCDCADCGCPATGKRGGDCKCSTDGKCKDCGPVKAGTPDKKKAKPKAAPAEKKDAPTEKKAAPEETKDAPAPKPAPESANNPAAI